MIVQLALLFARQNLQAPDFPPGMNAAVFGGMYLVETKLQAEDFSGAEKEAALLPKREIKIRWDAAKVPADRRQEFRSAFDKATKDWSEAEKIRFVEGEDPDIIFTFADALPKEPGTEFPAGATLAWKDGPERLDVTIALHRLETADEITTADVYNETAFAISQYLGLGRLSKFGSFSSRTDQSTTYTVVPNPYEFGLAKSVLDIADQLRELVAAKSKLTVHKPVMALAAGEITGVTGTQDEPLQVSFTVENRGDADLKLFVLPDCSCLRPQSPPLIKPHSSGTIIADVNTSQYIGPLNHSLLIYTNDPNWPMDEVPVHMQIDPLYRFVHAGPDGLQVGPSGLDFDLYLFFSNKLQIEPLTANILGPRGTVQFHKWSGVLPFDEVVKGPDSGYKFHIHLGPTNLEGQIGVTLMIGTDSAAYREINYGFNVQKGIAVTPQQVYFGRLSPRGSRASFFMSRPTKPFHVLRVESQDHRISAKVVPLGKDTGYRIDLKYSGSSDGGDLSSKIKVFTDDATQSQIIVGVAGSGR